MLSVYNRLGQQVPVTRVVAEPNTIVGLKEDKATLVYGKKKKTKKTENTFIKIAGYSPRFIREVSIKTTSEKPQEEPTLAPPTENSQENSNQQSAKLNLGDKITVSIFKAGDEVKVTGTTKGRGFAGGVKRWGFAGGPKTHGQSDRHRAPGSIGAGTDPGRVFKGQKMAGHMGNAKLTVRGLEVVEVDENKNSIFIKGQVPGPKNGLLIVEKIGRIKAREVPSHSVESNLRFRSFDKTQDRSELIEKLDNLDVRSEDSVPRDSRNSTSRDKQVSEVSKEEKESKKPATTESTEVKPENSEGGQNAAS